LSNTLRIAKNSLMLYTRQFLVMLVNLYTVRLVLEILGQEDYGIYNVVAGVVLMFGFLSNTMASTTQRFLSYEIGRKDTERLKNVFNQSISIYVLIMITVSVLAETAGLWFLDNKLIIPAGRKAAAFLVYQAAIISFLLTVLTSPYMAAVIAHEDMNIYAYVSIVEALLKLGIAFFLFYINYDKLKLYGILLCIVTFINTSIYRIVCNIKYKECKFNFYWNKNIFKEIFNYTKWSMAVMLSDVFKYQAVLVLINQYFNPVAAAAQSIANSLRNTISTFSWNFNNALRPQTIKSYAAGQKDEMITLMYRGTKVTFFLMYVVVLPSILEMSNVLSLWLKQLPEHGALLSRLAVLDIFIDSVTYSIILGISATGNIRSSCIWQSILLFLNLPLSWFVLSLGAPVWSVWIISLFLTGICFAVRLLITRTIVGLSLRVFIRKIIIPCFVVLVLSAPIPLLVHYVFRETFLRLLCTVLLSIISVSVFMYIVGLSRIEKHLVILTVKNQVRRIF